MGATDARGDGYFRLIVEHSPTAVVLVDAAGLITLVNRQTERLFGYPREVMLGRPIEFLVPAPLRQGHGVRRSRYLAQPSTRSMGVGRDLYGLRSDGTEVPIEIGLTPIETPQGSRVVASIIDIAERKLSEQALRRGEERFRLLVEHAPSAMLMVNESGSITLLNRQTETLFGYSRDELTGQPMEMLVPSRFRGAHPTLRGGFFSTPAARPMGIGRDLYGLRKDGTEVGIEIGLNPVETPEGVQVLATIIDITERKHAQRIIETSLREKTALLDEIHHRVKNNLQVVSSLLALQTRNTRDETARRLLDDAQGRVQAMALTHQLLYERKEYTRLHLGQYLDRLTRLQRQTLCRPDLARDLHAHGMQTPVYLGVDRAIPCGLIVNELVVNAFKHAFPGDRPGAVDVTLEAVDGSRVRVSVGDDGVGLPPDFGPGTCRTLGFQLISMLTEQVGGRMAIGSGPGTRIEILFDASVEHP